MFECVLNLSEGRNQDVLDELGRAAGTSLRDRHADTFHHRAVYTLINDPDALVRDCRALFAAAYQRLDLSGHLGVHPRFGVVDVVPFVALDPRRSDEAVALRDSTARWLAATYDVPVYLYGPLADGTVRSLPEVRRGAGRTLVADFGPREPSPHRGCVAVGARPILVAWNLWLDGVSLDDARAMAAAVRRTSVRALAFEVGDQVQVSCNLVDVVDARPSEVYDQVADRLGAGGSIRRAELVGLAPRALLDREDPARWAELGLSEEATIEARCGAQAG